jgi:hypothetical protein
MTILASCVVKSDGWQLLFAGTPYICGYLPPRDQPKEPVICANMNGLLEDCHGHVFLI